MSLKKIFLFSFIICTNAWSSPISQSRKDTIFFKNGDIYRVKILRINGDSIFYHTYNSEEEKFFNLTNIKSIGYDNEKIITPSKEDKWVEELMSRLDKVQEMLLPLKNMPKQSMYERGMDDAERYYLNERILTGELVAPFFFIGVGLVLAVIISFTKPSVSNIFKDDQRFKKANNYKAEVLNEVKILFKDPDYLKGYKKIARGKKARSFWFGVGAPFFFFLLTLDTTRKKRNRKYWLEVGLAFGFFFIYYTAILFILLFLF